MNWMQMMEGGELAGFCMEHLFPVTLLGVAFVLFLASLVRGRDTDFWETPQEWDETAPLEEEQKKPRSRRKFPPIVWLAYIVIIVRDFWDSPKALLGVAGMAVVFAVLVYLVERLVQWVHRE